MEHTEGECDTPGFTLVDTPKIQYDHKRTLKLMMPRNNNRLVQTSEDVLRGWRGNCDIQLLIYESPPEKMDPSEIARVTDYVVAYNCKGNKTLKQEREIYASLVLRYEHCFRNKERDRYYDFFFSLTAHIFVLERRNKPETTWTFRELQNKY